MLSWVLNQMQSHQNHLFTWVKKTQCTNVPEQSSCLQIPCSSQTHFKTLFSLKNCKDHDQKYISPSSIPCHKWYVLDLLRTSLLQNYCVLRIFWHCTPYHFAVIPWRAAFPRSRPGTNRSSNGWFLTRSRASGSLLCWLLVLYWCHTQSFPTYPT
jgi:hypothetical protein